MPVFGVIDRILLRFMPRFYSWRENHPPGQRKGNKTRAIKTAESCPE
jgi:hypothetical protein